jgi:hypothetical protein
MAGIVVLLALATVAQQAGPVVGADQPAAGAPASKNTVSIRSLEREKRAPVPYEEVNGHIIFRANVAGRDVWVLLDNLAFPSIIDASLARSAGLRIDPPSGTIRTPTGTVPKQRVWDVPMLVPGQLEVQTSLAAVDLAFISKAMGRKVEAVFGGDLLGQLAIKLDSGRRNLTFGPPGSSNVSAMIPMIPLQSQRAQLQVLVGDKPVTVALDLGSNGALTLTPEAWARVGSKDAVASSGLAAHGEGQVYAADIVRVPEVRLGSLTRKDVRISVRPMPGAADGTMGTALLTDTDFILDIKAGKLWLLPRLPSGLSTK